MQAANSAKGQSLDGDALDLDLLDLRVEGWKEGLGLIDQPEFPPKNVKMSDGAIKFHDRSHILVQDYLNKTSYDLCKVYGEESLPPVYEEILTFFCSKSIHRPDRDPRVKTTPDVLAGDILLMRHLGYIDNDSVFIKEISRISLEMGEFFLNMVNFEDFPIFRHTLLASTRDCKDWDDLIISG